ncbi:MAG: NADH-quinone oxidoreductase subunit NuoF [Candidatus Bipolaricaulota bacterium]
MARAFQDAVTRLGIERRVSLRISGCHGFCQAEPNVLVLPEGTFYANLRPEDVSEVVEAVVSGDVVQRLLFRDPRTDRSYRQWNEIPFFQSQVLRVLSLSPWVDPMSIDDYIAVGGYAGLAKAVSEMGPEGVLAEVQGSGLRGRGGAGFPTGKKWSFCSDAVADEKYVVCNADEGDPGAYMDRSVLEGNPHLVLEGMAIGGYAIGAGQGFVYVRDEYPLAVRHLEGAVRQAYERGLLGENILGTGFTFHMQVVRGAGAFVCGEETALMASIEGRRGMPRQRPPFPAQSGLWGRPTNINNVETWANVPAIVARGADWFAEVGTESSRGTKIFSLVGKVNNTGLVEVPMGMPLSEVVEIGGGVPEGKSCKAVQTGGPSGGCIPASLLDLPVDYERLAEAGSIMGSGGLVVMDEDTCMVDVARYFLEFLRDESCGKCLPCRVGIPRMLEILERIVSGQGQEDDLDRLETLGGTVQANSLCGLGQTAPNPVLSTLRHFREEYLAHIRDQACPARVCPSLIRYEVDPELCRGCDACRRACPQDAILGTLGEAPYRIREHLCVRCGACLRACRFEAISVLSGRVAEGATDE